MHDCKLPQAPRAAHVRPSPDYDPVAVAKASKISIPNKHILKDTLDHHGKVIKPEARKNMQQMIKDRDLDRFEEVSELKILIKLINFLFHQKNNPQTAHRQLQVHEKSKSCHTEACCTSTGVQSGRGGQDEQGVEAERAHPQGYPSSLR